ncbi:penicillin-binding protein activator [Psittacicella gerlachiana]|uniref:Penicillin-binding protein activator LpoA n=1 Tax=Psittacicella gerlachiana TaxID=2028574 RepID=A0A3A1YCV8_9GAMM|nr:penicillin-binding protein activator [Psittacicella gerlachiana]RIY35059.1 hypothetical protein CKF59_04185 [Psittacicella gerlachiana]
MNQTIKIASKLGVIATLSMALASCMLPQVNIGGGSSTSASQTIANYSSLSESEKEFVAQLLKTQSISTQTLINYYNTNSNPYVRNEIILKLVNNLINENKLDAAKYYLQNFTTSSDTRQNSTYNIVATRLGQLTNDQDLINNTTNVDFSQISLNQKLSAAKVEVVKQFANSQYNQGLDIVNEVFPSLSDADKQALVDFTLSQLTNLSVVSLSNLANGASTINSAWYTLASLAVENENDARALAQGFDTWSSTYAQSQNPAVSLTPSLFKQSQSAASSNYKNVTVLLPLTSNTVGELASAIQQGINTANQENKSPVRISYVDTNTTSAVQAVRDADGKADIIIGPLLRDNVVAVNQLTLTTPEIMLTSIGSYNVGACYYSMGIEDQVRTIANVMKQMNLNNPVIFSDGSSSSLRAISEFSRVWLEISQQNVNVINFSDDNLDANVKNLLGRTPAPDAVLFLGNAEQLVTFNSSLNFNNPENKVKTFATYRSNDETLTPAKLADLRNVYFTESAVIAEPKSTLANKANSSLKINNYNAKRLFAFGYDAFKLAQNYTALRTVNNYTVSGATGKIIIQPGRNCIVSSYYNVYNVVDGAFIKIN